MDEGIDYEKLPEILRLGVKRYVERGVLPGDFLRAVIQNNLQDAVCHAGPEILPLLKDIVLFFHWEVPGPCWKSEKAMTEWQTKGGTKGR